jgi:hypothetical protein
MAPARSARTGNQETGVLFCIFQYLWFSVAGICLPVLFRRDPHGSHQHDVISPFQRIPHLLVLTLLGLLVPSVSLALEKYGRPLPSMEQPDGAAAREAEETLFGGYFLTAAFVSNPTFAARPDNTGLVGLRHMLHLETDLYKQYLTFYTDQNFFSDRTKGWIELSEWDGTFALTGLVDRFG